jgi:hypothetical protein
LQRFTIRGETLKQFGQLDELLEDKVVLLETTCEEISKQLQTQYQPQFENEGQRILIEVIRSKNGKCAKKHDLYEEDYQSSIEIGIEADGEYYPNGYIPLWKCKREWFEKLGYLTSKSPEEIRKHIEAIVIDMLEEKKKDERD